MKYDGKMKLYNFLIGKNYEVPIMKRMEYTSFRGNEWLKYFGLKLFRPVHGIIYVTREEETEDGEIKRVEYSKYVDGVLDYQILNGKQTVLLGKRVQ